MNNLVKADSTLTKRLAERFYVEPGNLELALKSTAFKQPKDGIITDEQMMALMIVADQYGLNPFTKEIYAFPDKGGIVPVVGLDGWARIINENPQFDGIEFKWLGELVTLEHAKPCFEAVECIIYRKDRSHPTKVTEYLDEVYKPAYVKNRGRKDEYVMAGPWQTHTKRMLRHKATIQCSRLAFGFTGIFDQDEAENIIDVTPDGAETSKAEPPKPETKPPYPAEDFEKNKPVWLNLIEDGKSAEMIIKTISSKYDLSEDQVNEIRFLACDEVIEVEEPMEVTE